MVDLSKFEIIKKYLIGREFDAFRKNFSLICAILKVHESPDAAQHLSDAGEISDPL
jgi:hypothetical protein